MTDHIHKKFTTEQIKDLLERYIQKEIERKYIQEILGVKKRRFFDLLKDYRNNPNGFSINYFRKSPKRISKETEKCIIKEFKIDKKSSMIKIIPLDHTTIGEHSQFLTQFI